MFTMMKIIDLLKKMSLLEKSKASKNKCNYYNSDLLNFEVENEHCSSYNIIDKLSMPSLILAAIVCPVSRP